MRNETVFANMIDSYGGEVREAIRDHIRRQSEYSSHPVAGFHASTPAELYQLLKTEETFAMAYQHGFSEQDAIYQHVVSPYTDEVADVIGARENVEDWLGKEAVEPLPLSAPS